MEPADPSDSLRWGGRSGEGRRRTLGSYCTWQCKAQRCWRLRAPRLPRVSPVSWVSFGSPGTALQTWCGNPLQIKFPCLLYSSPNYPCMKTDAQLSLGVFNAASLFPPCSPHALFLVPDLFSLCFYGFCSSKTGCCLARRAVA